MFRFLPSQYTNVSRDLAKSYGKVLGVGVTVGLQSCALTLLNPAEEEQNSALDIPAGHSRVLALGSEFTFSTEVALCFGPPGFCEAKDAPLTTAALSKDIVDLRSERESDSTFVPGSSELLVVFAREPGDTKLSVSGELTDGTHVTREINLLVRQADSFQVEAICDDWIDEDLVFLEEVSVDMRAKTLFGDQVMEGEHPEALIADNLKREQSIRGMFILTPPKGSKSVLFRSALVPERSVRAQVYAANELRVINMRTVDSEVVRTQGGTVSIVADAEVNGKRACTIPSIQATVLTPEVCGNQPTLTFSSRLSANISVFESGTCELQFTDVAGVQKFAFDVKVETP